MTLHRTVLTTAQANQLHSKLGITSEFGSVLGILPFGQRSAFAGLHWKPFKTTVYAGKLPTIEEAMARNLQQVFDQYEVQTVGICIEDLNYRIRKGTTKKRLPTTNINEVLSDSMMYAMASGVIQGIIACRKDDVVICRAKYGEWLTTLGIELPVLNTKSRTRMQKARSWYRYNNAKMKAAEDYVHQRLDGLYPTACQRSGTLHGNYVQSFGMMLMVLDIQLAGIIPEKLSTKEGFPQVTTLMLKDKNWYEKIYKEEMCASEMNLLQ